MTGSMKEENHQTLEAIRFQDVLVIFITLIFSCCNTADSAFVCFGCELNDYTAACVFSSVPRTFSNMAADDEVVPEVLWQTLASLERGVRA